MADVKQSADQKAAKNAQNPAFDELATSIMVMYSIIERVANLLDADLSKTSRRPAETSDVYASGLRTADQLARMIAADKELSLDEKWLLQGAFRKWARFLAQNGSLWREHIYPNTQLANALISDGYAGLHGYSDPTWLRRTSITGNILRFLELFGTKVLEEQLQALSATLPLYRPGMSTSVEMFIDAKGIAHVSGGVQRAA